MTIEKICESVDLIKKRHEYSDIFSLFREMHILLLFYPMGSSLEACKGFFLKQSRIRSVTINSDLSENMQRIVAAHELGHAVLHAGTSGVNTFHDFNIFDKASLLEYEANVFAAELLMPDEEILRLLNDDISFFEVAKQLFVPAELLDFKFRIMKRKGYKIEPPMIAQSGFLKNV